MQTNTAAGPPAPTRAPRSVHFFAWGTFAAITFALIAIFFAFRNTDVWSIVSPSDGLRGQSYAEAVYGNSIFRTRANTWSNLAYMFVGLYVIGYAVWDARRKTTDRDPYAVRQPALMALFGVACFSLGIGSGLFHASLTRWAQQLDVGTMYAPLVVLVAIHWARWIPGVTVAKRFWRTWPLFAAVAIAVSLALYIYKWQLSSTNVMLTLLGIIWAGMIADALFGSFKSRHRWAGLAFVTLAASFTIRQLDVAGRLTGPDAWYQGHAFWHLGTAITLGCMAIYYRVEQPVERRSSARQPAAQPEHSTR